MKVLCKVVYYFLLGWVFLDPLQAYAIPEITVYGRRSRLPQAAKDGTGKQSFTVDPQSGQNLSEIVDASPAVTVLRSEGEGAAPIFSIRGQDPIQNRFFLEGVPLHDSQFGQSHLEFLGKDVVSGIDLYPGGVPVGFGSDGLGGAMNFRLVSPRHTGFGNLGAKTGAYNFFGTQGNIEYQSARFHAAYVQSNEDFSYLNNNGTPLNPLDDQIERRRNNRFRLLRFFPHVALRERSDQRWQLWSLHTVSYREIPGAVSTPTSGKLRDYFQLTAMTYERDYKRSKLASHLFARWHEQSLADIPASVGSRLGSFQARTLGAGGQGSLRFQLTNTLTGEGSMGVRVQSYTIRDEAGGDGGQARWQIPLGLGGEWVLGGVHIHPAVQAHYYAYADSVLGEENSQYFLLSPRIALRYPIGDWLQLRASGGRFYRAPTLFERYGSPNGIVANPELGYESAEKVEGGVDILLLDRTQFSYSFSYARAHQLISYVQNSQNSFRAVNIGESEILSHELALQSVLGYGFSLGTSFTWMNAINRSPVSYEFGKRLPLRPNPNFRIETAYRRKAWSLRYTLSLLGPAFWDVGNIQRLPAVWNHGAAISWDSGAWGSFTLEGHNLADTITASSTAQNTELESVDNTTGYAGYPAPGRRVYVSWQLAI